MHGPVVCYPQQAEQTTLLHMEIFKMLKGSLEWKTLCRKLDIFIVGFQKFPKSTLIF